MNLLDTNVLLWLAFAPEKLSVAVRKRLSSRREELAFSLVSIWEVSIKTSLNRPDFNVDPSVLLGALEAEEFVQLPIKAEHVVKVGKLEWHHRDPFDRLLVAQAQVEKCALITADATLARYGKFVKVVK